MKKYYLVRLVVFELALAIFLSLIISGLVFFNILKTDFVFIATLIAHIINIAILTFINTRHFKENGLLIGLITGLIYDSLSLIVRLLIDEPLDGKFWLKAFILILVAMASGTLTINLIKTNE